MRTTKIYLPYFAGLCVSLIFGLSFMFTKQALDSFSPMMLLSFRFAMAALVLTLLTLLGIIKLSYKGKPLKMLLLLAFFQPIFYFIFETTGVKLTSSSEAGMMIALIPVVVTVLAALVLKEKPTPLQLAFIFMSVFGVIFIILMSGGFSLEGHLDGTLALLGAVLAAGVYNILSRKLSKQFTPVEITFVMMWTGAVVFNLIALVQNLLHGDLSGYITPFSSIEAMIPIFYLGILSSVCAFFMVNFMLSKLPASNSAVFANLTTVISVLAGVFIRHEAFYWYQLVGGILIILGVWGTNYYKKPAVIKVEESLSSGQ